MSTTMTTRDLFAQYTRRPTQPTPTASAEPLFFGPCSYVLRGKPCTHSAIDAAASLCAEHRCTAWGTDTGAQARCDRPVRGVAGGLCDWHRKRLQRYHSTLPGQPLMHPGDHRPKGTGRKIATEYSRQCRRYQCTRPRFADRLCRTCWIDALGLEVDAVAATLQRACPALTWQQAYMRAVHTLVEAAEEANLPAWARTA